MRNRLTPFLICRILTKKFGAQHRFAHSFPQHLLNHSSNNVADFRKKGSNWRTLCYVIHYLNGLYDEL